MARLMYSAAMSLDGFIAGAGGDMSWLTAFIGPNPPVDELVKDVGALLVGNRTFRGDDPHKDTPNEGKAFSGAWSGPQVVLTHHVPATAVPGITFVSDLGQAVSAAKAVAGDKYVHVLGADTARQCLEAGVLDEIFTTIVPVLLGDGVRLFDHPGGATVTLERISLTEGPNAINVHMRVVR